MTVSNVTIQPIENLIGWYKVTFISWKNSIGETKTEMLFSEETLRMIRLQITQQIGENSNVLPKDFS